MVTRKSRVLSHSEIITIMSESYPGGIPTKTRFYSFYEQNFPVNKALTWSSYKELSKSGWRDGVCMRSRQGVDRKRVDFDIPYEKVKEKIKEWKAEGFREENIAFNQSMPNPHIRIQGEVREVNGIFHLRYSTVQKPMNLALAKEDLKTKDLQARMILRGNMDESSYADLEALLETFPMAVIEFGTYEVPVGNIPGRNTVFWEIRNY